MIFWNTLKQHPVIPAELVHTHLCSGRHGNAVHRQCRVRWFHGIHTAKDGDFSQAEMVTHTGALLVGTYDNFTDGDPAEFLRNLNAHMPTASENQLIFIEKTGHTYQMKHQEVADDILRQLQKWRTA